MQKINTSVFKFLWHYFSQRKIMFFAISLVCFLNEFLIRYALSLLADGVEALSLNLSREELFDRAGYYFVFATCVLFVNGVVSGSLYFLEARFMPYIVANISKDLFGFAHKHSTTFFSQELAGNVASKINNIIGTVYSMYYNLRSGFFNTFVALLITLGFLFKIDYLLSLIFLFLISVVTVVIYKRSKIHSQISKEVSEAESYSHGVLVDSIINADLVKSFSNFLFEKKNYFNSVKIATRLDKKETISYGRNFFVLNILLTVVQGVLFLLPLVFWYKERINLANLILVQSLTVMINTSLLAFCYRFPEFFSYNGKMKNGLELLARPFEIVDAKNAKELKIKNPSIEYKNVNYNYEEKNKLFNDLNLEIKAKQKIGLVGYSGSGKSTFIKLLLRYYDIKGGKILIDGKDIKKVKQNSLRNQIAVISQESNLFNRSILENIKYGNPKASDEDVYAAAKKAYIHDFIMSLPNKYQTTVGDRGIILSGGERQRVAIARAILKDAPILVLDEATSALDSLSEKYIQQSLKDLMKEKTVIAIAHRLSTLREMDKIVVMEKGEIIEAGSHKYLLSKKGLYAKLYSMQSDGFIDVE